MRCETPRNLNFQYTLYQFINDACDVNILSNVNIFTVEWGPPRLGGQGGGKWTETGTTRSVNRSVSPRINISQGKSSIWIDSCVLLLLCSSSDGAAVFLYFKEKSTIVLLLRRSLMLFDFYFVIFNPRFTTSLVTSFLCPLISGVLHDKWGDSLLLAEYSLSGPSSHLYLDYTEAAPTSLSILDDETFCASLSSGVGESEHGGRAQKASREVWCYSCNRDVIFSWLFLKIILFNCII